MEGPRYLDHAASTPLDPRVADAMSAALAKTGNPSSVHSFGRALREDVDRARTAVGRLFDVGASAVTFTSGATEANVLAITGFWRAARRARPGAPMKVLASRLEHASVMGAVAALEDGGAEVVWLDPGEDGVVPAEAVERAMTPEVALVTVMWANNVLGTVQPVGAIGRIVAQERARRGSGGTPLAFHCDAVQAVRTEDVRPRDAQVDLLTVSAHKMYGPKGAGALIRPSGVPIEPSSAGGGQEGGLRSGTENAAAVAGFGRAAEIMAAERAADASHAVALRELLVSELAARAPRVEAVGAASASVPGVIFLRHPSVPGDMLALSLDAAGFAVSAGSACDSGKRRSSHVLSAVLDERRAAHGGVRVSFGRFTAAQDVRDFAAALSAVSR